MGRPAGADGDTDRWRREADFFDQHAERAEITPLDPLVIHRYRQCSVDFAKFPLEFAVASIGPIAGKRVIDIGCGEGSNAVLFAAMGADVTGIDISPKAIEVANRRAAANAVSDRCSFSVENVEAMARTGETYDIVWCEAVLHHVIPSLPSVLESIRALAGASGKIVMIEPIALSPTLRAIRRLAPVPSDATPDERPLRRGELQTIESALPGMQTRVFRIVGRLDRFALGGAILERASPLRGGIVRGLARLDTRLAQIGFGRFASVAVMWR